MSATTVDINNLSNWLYSQPNNTKNTPYELIVTGTSVTSVALKSILEGFNNNSKFVDLSQTQLTNQYYDFQNLTCLVKAPPIPSGVTDISYAFYGCTNLIESPILPENLTSIGYAFRGCLSLVTAPAIPNTVTSMSYAFYQCTSMTTPPTSLPTSLIFGDYAFYGCTSLQSTPSMSAMTYRAPIMSNMYSHCTSLTYTKELPSYISQANNIFDGCTSLIGKEGGGTLELTVGSLYGILGLFQDCTSLNCQVKINCSDNNIIMRSVFKNCSSLTITPIVPTTLRAADSLFEGCSSLQTMATITSARSFPRTYKNCTSLTTGTLPSDLREMEETFSGCTALVNPPIFNYTSTVTDTRSTFKNCINLTTPLNKNSYNIVGAYYSDSMYEGCSSLTSISTITLHPNGTTYKRMFKNCVSLVSIGEVTCYSIPKYNWVKDYTENLEGIFEGCTSLTYVGVQEYDIKEGADWHIVRLKYGANNVSGKVFDKTGVATTISSTQITKTTLKLPILSDEILFSTSISDANLDSLIQDVITYKYTYHSDATQIVNPKEKSFVLWAENPNTVVTNLSFPADLSHASGVLPVANGGTGQTTQANTNKAIIGAMDTGSSDVTDGTEFVSSYASDNGFSDSNAPNVPYKRSFLKVWNYIKSKIQSIALNPIHIAKGGSIYADGTKANTPIIKMKDNTSDAYGNGIVIGGGGAVVIGAGESADTYYSGAGLLAGDESTRITSDQGIYFASNCNNGYSSRKEMALDTSGNLTVPTSFVTGDDNNGNWWASTSPRGKFIGTNGGSAGGWSPLLAGKTVNGKYEFGSLNNTIYLNYYKDSRTTNGIDKTIFSYTVDGTPSWEGNCTGNSGSSSRVASRGNVTCETGTTTPAVSGISMSQVYNNGYPITYGNVLTLAGMGHGQLLLGWSGSGGRANAYIRSKRDVQSTAWSNWYTLIDSGNIGSQSVRYATYVGSWTTSGATNVLNYISHSQIVGVSSTSTYTIQMGIFTGSSSGGKATIDSSQGFVAYKSASSYIIFLQDIDDNNPRSNTTQKDTGGYDYVTGVDQQYKDKFVVTCASGRKFYWFTIGEV